MSIWDDLQLSIDPPPPSPPPQDDNRLRWLLAGAVGAVLLLGIGLGAGLLIATEFLPGTTATPRVITATPDASLLQLPDNNAGMSGAIPDCPAVEMLPADEALYNAAYDHFNAADSYTLQIDGEFFGSTGDQSVRTEFELESIVRSSEGRSVVPELDMTLTSYTTPASYEAAGLPAVEVGGHVILKDGIYYMAVQAPALGLDGRDWKGISLERLFDLFVLENLPPVPAEGDIDDSTRDQYADVLSLLQLGDYIRVTQAGTSGNLSRYETTVCLLNFLLSPRFTTVASGIQIIDPTIPASDLNVNAFQAAVLSSTRRLNIQAENLIDPQAQEVRRIIFNADGVFGFDPSLIDLRLNATLSFSGYNRAYTVTAPDNPTMYDSYTTLFNSILSETTPPEVTMP